MDPEGVSVLWLLKIRGHTLTLCGKNSTEIHRVFTVVCGESTVDHSTVSCWVHRFRGGLYEHRWWFKTWKAKNINRCSWKRLSCDLCENLWRHISILHSDTWFEEEKIFCKMGPILCDGLSRKNARIRKGSVATSSLQPGHESTWLTCSQKWKNLRMCRCRYPSLEGLSTTVTRTIRQMNKNGVLDTTSKMLGFSHTQAGGLYWRTVKRYRKQINV